MTPEMCPLCKRLMDLRSLQPAGKRICFLCYGKIKKNHRWHIGSTGLLEHRDCKNPTGQIEIDNAKGMFD